MNVWFMIICRHDACTAYYLRQDTEPHYFYCNREKKLFSIQSIYLCKFSKNLKHLSLVILCCFCCFIIYTLFECLTNHQKLTIFSLLFHFFYKFAIINSCVPIHPNTCHNIINIKIQAIASNSCCWGCI